MFYAKTCITSNDSTFRQPIIYIDTKMYVKNYNNVSNNKAHSLVTKTHFEIIDVLIRVLLIQ